MVVAPARDPGSVARWNELLRVEAGLQERGDAAREVVGTGTVPVGDPLAIDLHQDLALDVLEETFLYLLRKFPRFKLAASLSGFVYRAIRDRAHQQETSTKFIVMKALAESGITIEPADLVEDGRRSKG